MLTLITVCLLVGGIVLHSVEAFDILGRNVHGPEPWQHYVAQAPGQDSIPFTGLAQVPRITIEANKYFKPFSAYSENGIIITVKYSGAAPCEYSPPKLVKNDDGTYTKPEISFIHAVACWSTMTWQEEWTALPENGGTFLRRIEKE